MAGAWLGVVRTAPARVMVSSWRKERERGKTVNVTRGETSAAQRRRLRHTEVLLTCEEEEQAQHLGAGGARGR